MILPDVRILVHAHNAGSPQHAAAREWWDAALSGEEPVALPWATVLGFIRITTNRMVLANPMTIGEAISRVEEWLQLPHIRTVHPTSEHPLILFGFLRGEGATGNLT